MDGKRSDSVESLPESLTERELEVLACLADGLSNQEIANKLYLAEQTVRWYNSQIYGKLGVSSRKEAIEQALALGLLQESSDNLSVTGKHNLPEQATPFVGRQHELVEVTTLLEDNSSRLITILAPGGMGKTRLALEVVRLQVGRYADGVIFVPLAPLRFATDIVTTIAENIGFSFYGENTPAQQLINFLRERSLLLLLDNFEHLLDGAQLVADLMQVAPHVHLLTTSRERLNLQGETVYTLRGMNFPSWETPEDALQYDAVKLFMQSAHRVRSDFTLQAHDLDYLARICRLTAGMPLGIQLAAGWVDVLSLEQIAAEIQKGIDILETEMRDVPERQRSVRATFDHTWERLTADEQAVFMRLSCFRGGFTIEAAEAVAGAGVRSLRQLANKALVQVSPDGRHDIHELLRQFGAEKLAASGEQVDVQTKHAAYFADFMAERKQDIRTNRQLEALELIDPDFENVRSAWLYIVNQQEWDQLPKFLYSLWFYLDVRTRGQETVELFIYSLRTRQSAPSSPATELARGRILARLGWFYNDTGFSEKGVIVSDEAIRILRLHESQEDLIAALHSRQNLAFVLNQSDVGVRVSQEGLSVAREIGNKNWEGHFLVWSGWISTLTGDFASAFQFVEEGLAVLEALGDRWGLLRGYELLGRIKLELQDYGQAKEWFEKEIVLAQAFGHLFSIGFNFMAQGRIALAEPNYPIARLHLTKALRVLWDAGYKSRVSYPLVYFAQMFADQNRFDSAAEILASIHKLLSEQSEEVEKVLRNQLEAKLDPEAFTAAWARGEKRELSAVVVELLAELEN